MEIEGTEFVSITIDRKTYEHDVVIRLSGEVIKRKKKLSKKYYGTSHVLSKDEAKFVFEKGCEQLIIGSGQIANVHLSPEAEAYFEKMAARSYCSLLPRRFAFSTNHLQRRWLRERMRWWSCFTLIAEANFCHSRKLGRNLFDFNR